MIKPNNELGFSRGGNLSIFAQVQRLAPFGKTLVFATFGDFGNWLLGSNADWFVILLEILADFFWFEKRQKNRDYPHRYSLYRLRFMTSFMYINHIMGSKISQYF